MLSEEEYSMLQGMSLRIEQLQKDNAELQRRLNIALESRRTLSEQLAKAKQDHHLTSDIARDSIKERDERINALRKLNAEHEGKIAALECCLRDKETLLKLVPEDALTIAKLTQLASMDK